jgi:hypothetical protein
MAHVARMNGADVFLVRAGDWRGSRRRRCVRGYRRDLRLRGRALVVVVRNRRPPLAYARGVHAGDERHDVGHVGGHWHELVRVACEGHMEGRLRGYWRGEVLGLVQDVVVSTKRRGG